jgi:hypothetical protein
MRAKNEAKDSGCKLLLTVLTSASVEIIWGLWGVIIADTTLKDRLSQPVLLSRLRAVFSELPDARKKSNNRRYEMEDAALSAFSVFFSQSPSFLDYQLRMQAAQGRNNATSLFGVHQIPSDNQIRNMLDPVAPSELFPFIAEIGDELYQGGYLEGFRSVEQTFLIALDGTDLFSSQAISCPCCSTVELKNGETHYRHTAVTPVLVAPEQSRVVVLPPEFVHPQDGHKKQDCELAASGRWLDQWAEHYVPRGITFLGDDLYCHQPFCERVRVKGAHFIFTCKPESHKTLYEWVGSAGQKDLAQTLIRERREGKKRFTDTYRYMNGVPLRNSVDALHVNWFELVTTNETGKVVFRSAWATSHTVTQNNIADLTKAARARWKIENENNNTLKTKGYHFEHNFGHGQKHLANLLATLILLAFLMHTTLDWIDSAYQTIRNALPSRKTFFEHLRALTLYLPFDDWNHLMRFMMKGLKITPHDTG